VKGAMRSIGLYKVRGIFRLTECILSSQKVLCSMESVISYLVTWNLDNVNVIPSQCDCANLPFCSSCDPFV
jgi:hypothetical protein